MTSFPADHFNPFPGLRPFEPEDNHLFFGREEQVKALLSRLARQRFLAVVGTSGCGKSSLVRAGLLPALDGGFMVAAGSAWRVAVMRPGVDPIGHLAAALHGPSAFEPGEDRSSQAIDPELATLMTETTLRRGALGLIEAVKLERMERGENLLIVVDQFEELFRFKQESTRKGAPDEAEAFVKLLLEGSWQTELSIFIVITMRSEYLGECSQFRELPEAINDSQVLVPRLTRDQLRQAIEAPVKVGGASISPALVNRLLNDIGDNQDQLPVLQHALMRTWDHWEARGHSSEPITMEDYQAIGGMERALSLHADEIYYGLASQAQRSIAQKLFRCLTEKDSGGRGIRRPTLVREVGSVAEAPPGDVIAIAESFRAPGRTFLMPSVSEVLDEDSLLDLSHESLMRIWDKLKVWVDEEAQSVQTYRRLAESAARHVRGEAASLREPELTIYGNWHQKQRPNAAWAERYAPGFERALSFLRLSQEEHEAELAEKERRREEESQREIEEANRARAAAEDRQQLLRRGLVGMGAFCLLALASVAYAWTQTKAAKKNEALAYAATSKALLQSNPFEALINGLAAINVLGNAQGESLSVIKVIGEAANLNWQIHHTHTTQGQVFRVVQLKNDELISAGENGTLRRWSRDGTNIGKPIETRQKQVLSLLELRNGELISGGMDGTLRRWRDGNSIGRKINTGQGWILSLVQLSNGELISGGSDGTLRRWRDGKPIGGKIDTSQGWVRGLVELSNGELISGGSDGSLRRWRDGKPIGGKTDTGQDGVESLVELRSGELISGGSDGSLRRWRNGKPIGGTIDTSQGGVLSLVELNNRELISGGMDGSLRRWRDGKPIGVKIDTGHGRVWQLLVLKDGTLISSGGDGSLRRWRDGKTIDPPVQTEHGVVTRLVGLKNGELLSGGSDGSLRRWRDDQPIGERITTGQNWILSLVELKNGEIISGAKDGSLQRWRGDTKIGEPIKTHQGQVESMLQLKNGELVTGGEDGSLRRWRDGNPIGGKIPTGQESVVSLVELSNGELISGGNDGTLRRWRDGKPIGEPIKTNHSNVVSLIQLKNGELISGGSDGSLQRWRDSKPIGAKTDTAQHGVWSLLELENGELVTGGEDGSLQLWRGDNPIGGKIQTHHGMVRSLLQLKNGKLISGGADGLLRYLSPPTTVITAACQELQKHPALLDPQRAVEKAASNACRSRELLK